MVMADSKIIVALDYHKEKPVFELVDKLSPQQCRLKVGKGLFTSVGPSIVQRLVASGFDVFLDLKFHDIPNTVIDACMHAADLGVWMVNVHCSGGMAMMQAAANAYAALKHAPYLIGVTVLTSLDNNDLNNIGIEGSVDQAVLRLAKLANVAGLDGVVCSAQELELLHNNISAPFLYVTPGIRMPKDNDVDQKRVMTPREALLKGASYLVIGRPITQAKDPVQAIADINASIHESAVE